MRFQKILLKLILTNFTMIMTLIMIQKFIRSKHIYHHSFQNRYLLSRLLSFMVSKFKVFIDIYFNFQFYFSSEYRSRSLLPLSVASESFVDTELIPLPIARNRQFGQSLVGSFYPKIVPFGPFGFTENFFYNYL